VATARHELEGASAALLGLPSAAVDGSSELGPVAETLISMLAASLAAEREARQAERDAAEQARAARSEATAAKLAAERLQGVATTALVARGLRRRRRARRQLRELLGI
jgi:hypothetical protein